MKLFTYKYLFKTVDMEQDKIGVKIVTDTEEGHAWFVEQIGNPENDILCLGLLREYLGEIECSRIGVVDTIIPMPSDVDTKNGYENHLLNMCDVVDDLGIKTKKKVKGEKENEKV